MTSLRKARRTCRAPQSVTGGFLQKQAIFGLSLQICRYRLYAAYVNSRAKGCRGERELAHELIRLGMFAARSQQYCGRAGDADLDVRGLQLHVECKRTGRARVAEFMAQAKRDSHGKAHAVFMRLDGMRDWLVIQTLDQWASDSAIAKAAIDAQRTFLEQANEASTVPTPPVR